MRDFFAEVRARADEGYSTRQLMSSLIPDIGTELKVADSEVTAALRDKQVAFRGQAMEKEYVFTFLYSVHFL